MEPGKPDLARDEGSPGAGNPVDRSESDPDRESLSLSSSSVSGSSSVGGSGCGGPGKSRRYVYGTGTGGSFSITLKHYDSLVGEVKCPGCAEPMDGPISMCQSGHSICDACRHQSGTVCPLCDAPFTELRNYTLEAIASKVQFPCKNAARGCTVRLPLQLLRWHRERCGYKPIECFMGKVWDECRWQGCARDFAAHCLAEHADRVYDGPQVTLHWDCQGDSPRISARLQLVVAYYVIRAFEELFNLYQIYDPDRRTILWTVICATKEPRVSGRYTFELELYSSVESWKLLVQRFPCHSELEQDILADWNCAKLALSDAQRFMAADKVLHYRVRILEVGPSRSRSLGTLGDSVDRLALIGPSTTTTEQRPSTDTDFQHCSSTRIENVNLKAVPERNIISRQGSQVAQVPLLPSSPNADDDDDDGVFLPYIDDDVAGCPAGLKGAISTPILHRGASYSPPPHKPARAVTFEQHPLQQQLQLDRFSWPAAEVAADRERESCTTRAVVPKTPDRNLTKGTTATATAAAAGLSKFYHVTRVKAAKFLEKKRLK
ncbi:uncharacterized protein LOC128276879 [Anopheles cruzii]|uniref:uncharacterized protein LOC128276879 n=1 Tax=Anopheles cruzii TaxID=68878 RepID=UPI0022EC659E|nr:uncharacterized protein LOC128276879 [Anopheles cruzii]